MAITWRFFALYTDPGRSTELNFSSLSPAHSPRYAAACTRRTPRMCEHALLKPMPSYTTISHTASFSILLFRGIPTIILCNGGT